jgi:valyl-tRNA synthetase
VVPLTDVDATRYPVATDPTNEPMTEPLSPQFDPQAIETPLYRHWEEKGYFRASASHVREGREPYVIVIPPPNVTAVLHMGHGLNNSIQDVLIRWQRMRGREALYLPGTDHAGIATQNVVEKMLAAEGLTRDDLGRDAFVERVWAFVDQTGSTILEQLKAIGCSCDWTRTRFTLEPALSHAVRVVFVRLYEKNLVYRGNYIINWCPRCKTALSDEEAEAEETNGRLWHLRYPLHESRPDLGLPTLPDGRQYITVATTRPETMFGDTGVAVHPTDERYRLLVGSTIDLPLADRRIPIFADAWVDPEFGSGAVKVTPAHDPNDFAMADRNGIPALDVLTPDAKMNDNAPEAFRGIDRFEARKRVVAALDELGLLERAEDHTHAVPHCYRCGTIVEPRLSEQWFVRMRPLADPALEASRTGRIRFTPERHRKVYESWLENIRDWCISRQLWWGHRIPVWYCRSDGCTETIVAVDEPTACTKCGGTNLDQDPDVLDTWFSSWLWPFSTLGWPDPNEDLDAFYPTNTLVTAPEILFFWVARMIMAGIEFMGDIPFTDVYLNGTVRDLQHRKMSKSLGNGIDPLEVVRLYGADALRFTVVSAQGLGTDLYMDPDNLEETFAPGRNFANKIWNAVRFALMNIGESSVRSVTASRAGLELADRWILSRLDTAAAEVTRQLEGLRFHEAADAAYHFFWDELAAWYIELVKPRLRDDAPEESRQTARATLVAALDGALRLLHPIMPFITEALWQRLPDAEGETCAESLMVEQWPEGGGAMRDDDAEAGMNALVELIGSIRTLRNEYRVPDGAHVSIQLANIAPELAYALESESRALERMARVGRFERRTDGAQGAGAHAVLTGGTELFVPIAELIDLDRERSRLGQEIERLENQLRGTEARLANPGFTGGAPPDVVQREREKADNFRDQLGRLATKLAGLG